jgi:hypothetical protein
VREPADVVQRADVELVMQEWLLIQPDREGLLLANRSRVEQTLRRPSDAIRRTVPRPLSAK